MPKINLSVSVTTPTGTTPVRHVPDVWPSLLPSTVAYELYGLDTNLSFNLAEAIAECALMGGPEAWFAGATRWEGPVYYGEAATMAHRYGFGDRRLILVMTRSGRIDGAEAA